MRIVVLSVLALVVGCEAGDPEITPRDTGSTVVDTEVIDTSTTDTGSAGDGGDADAAPACTSVEMVTPQPADPSCKPKAMDYRPGATDDGWTMACISDDNAYHRFSESISTITRIAAFDEISKLLGFGTDKVPTADDFINARTVFAADQGLGSRVERREDEHYPAAPKACNTMTADELMMYRDRCAGPAKILPIVNAAFTEGAMGKNGRANGDRLEGAFLWFLYLSPYKEARTCTTAAVDCDSSYAYYTGGDPRSDGKGFARYVKARSQQTHDAIWDGILAVRCWRDLDNPTGTATNLTLRDQAVDQLDRAMNKGLAVIVRQRVARRMCGGWISTQIIGGVLDREATKRDAAKAAALRTEFAKNDPATVDEKALFAALDALFPCAW
jgi:hypothetical protein